MMVRLALLAFLAVVDATGQTHGMRDQSHQSGVKASVLSLIFTQLPRDIHICATYAYPTVSGSTEVALLTASEHAGWEVRIYDYNRRTGRIESQWQSGKLPPEFGVSSAAHFRLVGPDALHDAENVEFTGCLQHDCPASYAVVVYSPSRRRAFQAIVSEGKTRFSPELEQPSNKVLKAYLDARLIKMQED